MNFDFNSVKKQSHTNNSAFNINDHIIELVRKFFFLTFKIPSNAFETRKINEQDLNIYKNGNLIEVWPRYPFEKFVIQIEEDDIEEDEDDIEEFNYLLKNLKGILKHIQFNGYILLKYNTFLEYKDQMKTIAQFNSISSIILYPDVRFTKNTVEFIRNISNVGSFIINSDISYFYKDYPSGLFRNKNLYIDRIIDIYENDWRNQNLKSLLSDAKRIHSIIINDNHCDEAINQLQNKCNNLVFAEDVRIPTYIPITAKAVYFAPDADDMIDETHKFQFPNLRNCSNVTIYLGKALNDLHKKFSRFDKRTDCLYNFLTKLDELSLSTINMDECLLVMTEEQKNYYFNNNKFESMSFDIKWDIDTDVHNYCDFWNSINDLDI